MSLNSNQRGLGALNILIIAGAVFLIVLAGWSVFAVISNRSQGGKDGVGSPSGQTNDDALDDSANTGKIVRWQVDSAGRWKAQDPNPPSCPVQPMMQAPSAMTYLTLVQYPGRSRDGHYQTTGRLHFNGVKNSDIEIVAPMDATFYRAARYKVNGETQYTLDFVNSCGVMYRLGHLGALTATLESLVTSLPETSEFDGKTSPIPEGVTVSAGERIATSIGFTKTGQTFYDFGVYDLRASNSYAQNSAYIKRNGLELAGHAVCWFDWIPGTESAKVHVSTKKQPEADKKNDYCTIDR